MPFLDSSSSQRRIAELSQQWDVRLPPPLLPLTRPQHHPTFRTTTDDQIAEDQLQRQALDAVQSRRKSGLSKAFSSNNLKKTKNVEPRDILEVLNAWVANCGSPGVAEALIAKLEETGVDLSGHQRQKSGILSRKRSVEGLTDKTKLLKYAVERDQSEMVQVLLPHVDPPALDACVVYAIRGGNAQIAELLLSHGANATLAVDGQEALRHASTTPALSSLVGLILRSDKQPHPQLLSQCLVGATRSGILDTVLLLVRSGAYGDYNQAEALKIAVQMGRRDLAAAIVMAPQPPQRPGLDEAFNALFQHRSISPAAKLELAELLLCAGAQGDPVSHALQEACHSQWFDMANLLASHGASVNYQGGTMLKTVIAQQQLDLAGALLNEKTSIDHNLASSCVASIPRHASKEHRYALLRLLLSKGAAGDSLSECLIHAVEAADAESIDLLLSPAPRDRKHSGTHAQHKAPANVLSSNPQATASTDFRSGEALKIAVSKNDAVVLQKLLAARPTLSTLTSVFPFTQNLPARERYKMTELFLKSGLTGPSLHGALQSAINQEAAHRDDVLIKLLLHYGADINYNNGAGLHAVIAQANVNLLGSLVQNATAETAAARIHEVMEVADHRSRHDMLGMLLRACSGTKQVEVANALLRTLQEQPVDISLLRLLLQQGTADVGAMDGKILKVAIANPDPKVFDLLLSHSKMTREIFHACLRELAPLLSTASKAWKLEMILSRSKRKEDLSVILVHEIQSLLRNDVHDSSTATLKKLLDAGADPNLHQSASICYAVAAGNEKISDLLFNCAKAPNSASLSTALPHALRIPDPATRLVFVRKLVDAGAVPVEVNRALIHAITNFPDELSMIKVLAQGANTEDGEALITSATKENCKILTILLQDTKHTHETRGLVLTKAMEIRDRSLREKMCRCLLEAGIQTEAASNALLVAARDGDLQLGDLLMSFGANISTNNGQAIIEACRGGSAEVLEVLLRSEGSTQTRILDQGFQAATEVGDLSKRAIIFEKLLKKGVTGEVIDAQLSSAARYGEDGQGILRILLAAGADPNHDNGEAVYAATRSAFIGNLELLLGLWTDTSNQVSDESKLKTPWLTKGGQKPPSHSTLVRALKASWNLNRDSRFRVIQDLVKAGLPVTQDSHIALNDAVNEENIEERLVKLLLDHGASPSSNGGRSLIDATKGMQSPIVNLLLDREISQDDLNTVFEQAFSSDRFEIWFTDSGLDIASTLLDKGATGPALTYALCMVMERCGADNVTLSNQFVATLVAHKPDVNHNDGEALQLAASRAHVEWLVALLECRPSTQSLTHAFRRIFDTALDESDALALFELLSRYQDGEARVNLAAVLEGSESLLARATTQYPRSTAILESLLDAGCYHDQTVRWCLHPDCDEEEVTFLTWAIVQPQKRVSTAVIQVLLDRGGEYPLNPPNVVASWFRWLTQFATANVNVESSITKSSPLMTAIRTRRPDVVKALLLDQAEVDTVDAFGQSPLSLATNIGGELAIELMGSLLAAEPSKDDGSLHNTVRELNLPAVKVLIQAGHDPDFPSPLHDGRNALGEACLHATDPGQLSPEREKHVAKVMSLLIAAGSDLSIQANGKSVLFLCFEAVDAVGTCRVLLKAGMWKHVNKSFNLYKNGNLVYSPTMYIQELMPPSEAKEQLLKLLRGNRAKDIFYAISGPQPRGAIGLPEDVEVRERERMARQERMAEETEDFAITMARRRELASVEQQIWHQKSQMEDARRLKLHNEDMNAVRSRFGLEESLATTTNQRKLSEHRLLTNATVDQNRAIAAATSEAEEKQQRKLLEHEGRMNTERVDNARMLSALRVSEREEVDKLDKGAEERIRKRIEAQKKLVEGQERLAKRLAEGAGGIDVRKQIGYVTELN